MRKNVLRHGNGGHLVAEEVLVGKTEQQKSSSLLTVRGAAREKPSGQEAKKGVCRPAPKKMNVERGKTALLSKCSTM